MRFDSKAPGYDRHAGPQREFAAQTASVILERAKSGGCVLELGAGTGALTRLLCGAGLRVLATDGSPAMQSLGQQAVPDAEWGVFDAFAAVPPAAELQVSSGLLQWAAQPLPVLGGWASALLPGGRMIHSFPCLPCLDEWRSIVPDGPLVWRDRGEWVAIFEEAGLEVVQECQWTRIVHYPGALDLVRSMHEGGMTGRTRMGTGGLRRAMREYGARFSQAGGVGATWVWQLIEARVSG